MLYDETLKREVREIKEVNLKEANELLTTGWNYLGYKVNTEFESIPAFNDNPNTITSFTYIVGRVDYI